MLRPGQPTNSLTNQDITLEPSLIELIRELAAGMDDANNIVVRHGFAGLGDPEWLKLQHNPAFDKLLREAIREWGAVTSTQKRVRLKALTMLEANILNLQDVLGHNNTATRIDAFKFLYELAGLKGTPENPAQGGGGGGGFSITLNIGTGDGAKTLSVKSQPATIEHEDTPALDVVLSEGESQ